MESVAETNQRATQEEAKIGLEASSIDRTETNRPPRIVTGLNSEEMGTVQVTDSQDAKMPGGLVAGDSIVQEFG